MATAVDHSLDAQGEKSTLRPGACGQLQHIATEAW